jgi:uncharacterized protein (TIGR02594 family)
MISTRQIQVALQRDGLDPGPIDGIRGKKTELAILTFNAKYGFPPVASLTESGLKILRLTTTAIPEPLALPWLNEVGQYMGLHEVKDKKKLAAWLRFGGSVGDPSKLPWCADLVETAIKKTLPDEPFTGKLKINPYYSLNWLEFGIPTTMCYGCIAIFVRPGGGHIGFVIGYDPKRKRYRLRNGNVSDKVCDSWLDASRCKGLRWPVTYTGPRLPVPIMDSTGAVISTNEH